MATKIKTFIREQLYIIKGVLEGNIFPVPQPTGKKKRRKKCKPSRECQKILNEANSKKKFIRLVRLNFGNGDVFVTLTFATGKEPRTNEEAKKATENFIRRLKRLFKKKGVELRYVCSIECGDKGRWHIHFIITGGLKREEIEKAWGLGLINTEAFPACPDEQEELASYLIKSRMFYRSYKASRNLEQPKPQEHDARLSVADAWDAAKAIDEKREHQWFEHKYPGYELIEAKRIPNEYISYPYIQFKMKKKPPPAISWVVDGGDEDEDIACWSFDNPTYNLPF